MKKQTELQRKRAKTTGGAWLNVLFSGVRKAWLAVKIVYLETLYKAHLQIRYGHDYAYKNVKVYKNYSDSPASKVVHKTVVWAFIASFTAFTFMQYVAPNIFNFATPNKAYAGAPNKTWTTRGDFLGGSPDANLTISGTNNADNADVSLTNSWSWGTAPTTTDAPVARNGHTAIWTGSKMIVWGGNLSASPYYSNTGGIYDPVANSWVATSSTNAPAIRVNHTAIWTGSNMVIWGGYNGAGTKLNTGGIWVPNGGQNPDYTACSTAGGCWTAMTTTGAPVGRSSHTAIWTGSNMVVWGGCTSSDFCSAATSTGGIWVPKTGAKPDGSTCSTTGGCWSATASTGVPAARLAHSTIWTGSKMIVWGGSGSGKLNTGGIWVPNGGINPDGWDCSLAVGCWTATSTINAPVGRDSATAVWTGSKMIIYGGSASTFINTGGLYDPVTDNWTATTTSNMGCSQAYNISVWTGSKMIVWGGYYYDGITRLTDGTTCMYSPTDNNWTVVAPTGAPVVRIYSSSVWTGSKMIVWGGSDINNTNYNTGGSFGSLYASSGTISGLKISAESAAKWGTISWAETGVASALSSTSYIRFRTRGATTFGGLTSATWSGYTDVQSGTSGNNVPITTAPTNTQFLEIELTLVSASGTSTPIVDWVRADYDTIESPQNANTTLAKSGPTPLKTNVGATIGANGIGGYTNETSLTVTATGLTCTDCAGDTTGREVQVQYKKTEDGAFDSPTVDEATNLFNGTAGSGASVTSVATLTGLTDAKSYQLRARTTDNAGRLSGWVYYGSGANSAAETDFTVEQSMPAISNFSVKATATGLENYLDVSRMISIAGGANKTTTSDLGGSSPNVTGNLKIQLSENGTSWGYYDTDSGTNIMDNSVSDVKSYKVITPSASPQVDIANAWKTSAGDGSKTIYVRAIDNAGNNTGAGQGNTWTTQNDFNGTTQGATTTRTVNIDLTTTADSIQLTPAGSQNVNVNYGLGGDSGKTTSGTYTLAIPSSVTAISIEIDGAGGGGDDPTGPIAGGAGGATSVSVESNSAYSATATGGSGTGVTGQTSIGASGFNGLTRQNGQGNNGGTGGTIVGGGQSYYTGWCWIDWGEGYGPQWTEDYGNDIDCLNDGGEPEYIAGDTTGASGGKGGKVTGSITPSLVSSQNLTIVVGVGGLKGNAGAGTAGNDGSIGTVKVSYTYTLSGVQSGTLGASGTGLRYGDAGGASQDWANIHWVGSGLTSGNNVGIKVRASDSFGSGSYVNPFDNTNLFYPLTTGNSGDIPISADIANSKTIEIQLELNSDGTGMPVLSSLLIETLANNPSDSITLDTTPPAQVAGLASKSASGGAVLDETTWYEHSAPYFHWTANGDSDLAGYKYCFSTNSGCTPTTTVTPTATNNFQTLDLSDTSTYPDGAYYFSVIAVDSAENTSTNVTQRVYKLDRNVPGIVAGYSASQNYDTYIHVQWAEVSKNGGSDITYVLERIPYVTYIEGGYQTADIGEKIWSNLSTYKQFDPTSLLSINENTSEDVGIVNRLISGTKYAYRIKAYDVTGKSSSAYQNDTFYGLTRDGTNPTPPTGVSALACSYQDLDYCETTNNALKGHQITVRWNPGSDAGTGIVAYEIYRATTNAQLEASYGTVPIATVTVPNPLPVMDQYATLVYRDNDLSDYTTYHYRVVSVDGAEDETYPANKSRIVENLNDYGNYAFTNTPDVTAPDVTSNGAAVVTANTGGIDDSGNKQKMIISWTEAVETGIGIKEYKLYKANRADTTEQSGTLTDDEFSDITNAANVTCTMLTRTCVEQGLDDYRWYYYRVKATDGDPYNNVSVYSNTAYKKTLSSAVPTPPRGRKDPDTQVYEQYPYVYSVKGNPSSEGSVVGKEITVSFTGSYEKDCILGPNIPCLIKYEIFRSTNNLTWSKVGNDITPIRIDNDVDNRYDFTDSTVSGETQYYYRVRAVGNNPDLSLEDNTTESGIGSAKYQGWDVTPDVHAPDLPAGLKVKDIHDDGMNFKRNIITWARIAEPQRNGINGLINDFKEYRIFRSTDGLIWSQICKDGINTVYRTGGCTTQYPNPLYDANKEIGLATNYLMDLIPISSANQDYYYYVSAVDDAGDSFKYAVDNTVINSISNVSEPNRDSQNKIIAVNINPAIAQPTITRTGANMPKVYDIGVASATIEWYADQLTDSVVEFKSTEANDWVTIGDRTQKAYNEPHTVQLFGLSPETTYQYRIISRNGLGNEDIVGDNGSELQYVPNFTTSAFTITYQTEKTDVTTVSATLSWTTNMPSNTNMVEYKENAGTTTLSASEPPLTLSLIPLNRRNCATTSKLCEHSVTLSPLKKYTDYTFRIIAVSLDNFNSSTGMLPLKTANSDAKQFTITPSASNVSERNITATSAQIVFQTAEPTTAVLYYDTKSGAPNYDTKSYKLTATDSSLGTTHVIMLEALEPGVKYYYIVSVNNGLLSYTSPESNFTAVLKPKISNLRVAEIKPYSFKLSWDTNVETETLINFGKTTAYGEKRGKQGMVKAHELEVIQLEDNQEYHYQILAKDETGEEVADEDKFLRTPMDTEGPKITGVKIDVLPMGESDSTSSIIVSWQTDKPATTLVEYDEGVIGGSYNKQSVEDLSLNNSHTVIIKGLAPASSYHYRLVSSDKRANKTVSQDYTFVTPSKEKSILQLIIKSLEETFAWTRNLNQFFGNIGKRITGK